jgi:hypothetical protein
MYSDKKVEIKNGLDYEDFITKKYLLPAFRKKFGSGITIEKNDTFANFDRTVLLNNQKLGEIEIKQRDCNKDTYPTSVIGIEKYKEQQANNTMDYWLVVGWKDAVGILKMNNTKPVKIDLERADRKDGEKPHVGYNIKDFTIIG